MEYGTSNKQEKQKCMVFRCLQWWILFILALNIGYHNGKLLEILDLKNIVCLFVFRGDPWFWLPPQKKVGEYTYSVL